MDLQNTSCDDLNRLAKLRRFARLAPQDPEVHLALARELMGGSMQEEALTELHTVISLAPNHLEARKLLAQVTGDTQHQAR